MTSKGPGATSPDPHARGDVLHFGDNLEVLRRHVKDASVDLVYLDPPFGSGREYHLLGEEGAGSRRESRVRAFADRWSWDEEAERSLASLRAEGCGAGERHLATTLDALIASLGGRGEIAAYLARMAPRLLEVRRVLRPTGSLYLHCDPGASHYLKVLLDAVLGGRNFRREIVWRSGWVSGFKAAARNWARNHDVILYYVKDRDAAWTFHKERAYLPHRPGYRRRGGGENPMGTALDDVWTDIHSPWILSFSKEKLGWPTQKPLALLRRILEVSTSPGDTVLDPFNGCGTTLAACRQLSPRRRAVAVDISPLSIAVTIDRLRELGGDSTLDVVGGPATIAEVEALAAGPGGGERFRWWTAWRLGGRPLRTRSNGMDAEIPLSGGGTPGAAGRALLYVVGGLERGAPVRDLLRAMERVGAACGVLVSLLEPPAAWREQAAAAGVQGGGPSGAMPPRILVLTAAEVVGGRLPDLVAPPGGSPSRDPP